MAQRDPNKAARNRIIKNITKRMRDILPLALSETNISNQASLNAKIGSKADRFFDLKTEVIHSHFEFTNKWLTGLKRAAANDSGAACVWINNALRTSASFKEYLLLFLKRSYLKRFDELSKNRPSENDSEVWIGQENATYGLLVTPRFRNSQWENDKSEIRSFKCGYWTVGHVLSTGLVIPGQNEVMGFEDVEQFLRFFRNTLVRSSGSSYEYDIAGFYNDYVRNSADPLSIPLMIPEFRYDGLKRKHKYRLDFMITDPYTLNKVGFELSPWSTHGYLRKIKGLSGKEINKMAADNFTKEMRKHREYFKRYNVYTLIYADDALANCQKLFVEDIFPLLSPEKPDNPISFTTMEEFI